MLKKKAVLATAAAVLAANVLSVFGGVSALDAYDPLAPALNYKIPYDAKVPDTYTMFDVMDHPLVLKPGVVDICAVRMFVDPENEANKTSYNEFHKTIGPIGADKVPGEDQVALDRITNHQMGIGFVGPIVYSRTRWTYDTGMTATDNDAMIWEIVPGTYFGAMLHFFLKDGSPLDADGYAAKHTVWHSADGTTWTQLTGDAVTYTKTQDQETTVHAFAYLIAAKLPDTAKYVKIQFPSLKDTQDNVTGDWGATTGFLSNGIGPVKASKTPITGVDEDTYGDPNVAWYNLSSADAAVTIDGAKIALSFEKESDAISLTDLLAKLTVVNGSVKFFNGATEITDLSTKVANGMTAKLLNEAGGVAEEYTVNVTITGGGTTDPGEGGEGGDNDDDDKPITDVGVFPNKDSGITVDNATGKITMESAMTIKEFKESCTINGVVLTFKDADGKEITDENTKITSDMTVNFMTEVVDLGDYTFEIADEGDGGNDDGGAPKTGTSSSGAMFLIFFAGMGACLVFAKKRVLNK